MSMSFIVEVPDNYEKALNIIKSLLMSDETTGITHETSLDKVYAECAMVGIAVLSMNMESDGSYARFASEVELGDAVDDILRDC